MTPSKFAVSYAAIPDDESRPSIRIKRGIAALDSRRFIYSTILDIHRICRPQ